MRILATENYQWTTPTSSTLSVFLHDKNQREDLSAKEVGNAHS